ncbi:MAG TPA: hypothetical protein VHP14_21995 [Anaerolineales bacterium]|nr:hypothetical protein [Anaerolineales bacterium]
MKSIPLAKALLILLLLVIAVIGSMYIARFLLPSSGFSTSYRDFPDPEPIPTDEPKDVVNVPGMIHAFDVSADGKRIAIATSTDLIVYDLQMLKELHSLPVHEHVFRVQFSPDGGKLAVSAIILKYLGSGPLHVTVWDTASWKIIYEYTSASQGAVPEGALSWSPNREQIAFSIPERGLSVVEVGSGDVVASVEDFIVPPFDLSWSPDGIRLISTGDLGYGLRRWRVDTNKWVRLWDKRLQPAQEVAWSPDGKRIASGHFGGAVCVWNTRNNQCEGLIDAHFNSVNALDWSPDSKQIATASGAIRLWDADTGKLSSGFGFYDGIIYRELRWFDSSTIATLETSYTKSVPSTIRFWDVATGDVKLAFHGWDNIESPSTGGVMLVLDDIQISSEQTVLQVSLRFDTPQHSVAGQWNVIMTDSQGRIYPLKDITPDTMDIGTSRVYQTVPLPLGEQIVLDLVSFPQPAQMPLMLDLSTNPGKFTFDPSKLQIGESMTLDEEIQADGNLLRLIGVRKPSTNELLFEFDPQEYLNGVALFASQAGDSSTNLVEKNKIISSLSFSEMPDEPMEIDVTRIFYNAYGSWPLAFRVAPSMFTDQLSASAPELTPTPQPEPDFTSQDPLFLEVKALTDKFNKSVAQGSGWVRVVSEVVTRNLQPGQNYPPPYYREEQWFEIDTEGWVTRNLVTHWSKDGSIIQQSISVGTHSLNLTTGEAMEFPIYRLSLDWFLRDLDYALRHGEIVVREEATCEDGSSCLLVTVNEMNIARRVWISMETGQQVKLQTSQRDSDGAETILFTQTFLPVERMDAPPQEVLDLFVRVVFPVP